MPGLLRYFLYTERKKRKKKARPVSEGWGEDVVLLRCGWADEGATAVGGRAIAKSSQRNYFRTLLETLLFVVLYGIPSADPEKKKKSSKQLFKKEDKKETVHPPAALFPPRNV
jgi:hypothetical protein